MKKFLIVLPLGVFGFSQAVELKNEFGNFNLNGALSSYVIYSDNKTDAKKTRFDIASAILSISKSAKPFGFTIYGGAYATPVLGAGLLKTTDYTNFFSALPVAYLEYAPIDDLSIQVGKLPTIIGFESLFTYQNNYLQRGLIWNMQPVINNGVRILYTKEKYFLKAGINDGFYTLSTTHPKMAFEGSLGLTPIKDFSLSFNFLIPDKSSRPNDTAIPSNKREYNILSTYTINNLSLGLDLVYIEAPKDDNAGVIEKSKASGGALHLSYSLTQNFKISSRIEYFKDNADNGNIDLVGLGDGNKGYSFTLTPMYQKGNIYLKTEFTYVKADKNFAQNSSKDNQSRIGLELGFSF